ncbi:hypothetical protein LDJ79_23940 [Vibrio tritonius]|uniref:DUF4440 domain-containing protein n=1 Tax=Vibrio tritonius TaxID=1435069 RepID=A0ABS7YXZ5_9VIBR|nr:hypothetical protein [Vibrio tritonius]MCA2019175.1 hypothetical protein [Vibrio tritonius]
MNFEDLSDQQILDIANPIMDNLMDASTRIDHENHVRDFTNRMKEIVTKDYLQKVCEHYQFEKGYFYQRELVAVFKRPNSAVIVWKQTFTKAKGDFVAEMVLVKVDGKYLCDHVMVF